MNLVLHLPQIVPGEGQITYDTGRGNCPTAKELETKASAILWQIEKKKGLSQDIPDKKRFLIMAAGLGI